MVNLFRKDVIRGLEVLVEAGEKYGDTTVDQTHMYSKHPFEGAYI